MEQLFRGLEPDEIEVRVGSISQKGASLLLYKDARCDMNILDSVFTPFGWERKHEAIKNNLFCSVGIKAESGEWVWKQDCGTESNTEKEKGEASDSFKRACFNWGIGRELYTAGKIFVSCQTEASGGNKYKLKNPFEFYGVKVRSIEYDETTKQRTIVGLVIEDRNGEIIYSRNAKATPTKKPTPKASTKDIQSTPNEPILVPVADDNAIANEFIGEDELATLKNEFKRTGITEPVIIKQYGLELLSEMTMKEFYDCIRRFEQTATKKSNTGIK